MAEEMYLFNSVINNGKGVGRGIHFFQREPSSCIGGSGKIEQASTEKYTIFDDMKKKKYMFNFQTIPSESCNKKYGFRQPEDGKF